MCTCNIPIVKQVNELLKRQVHTNNGSAAQDQSTLNPQLVIDLANEVERLKHSLNEEQLKNSRYAFTKHYIVNFLFFDMGIAVFISFMVS